MHGIFKATAEEKEAAQFALNKYDSIADPGSRKRFLKLFQDHGAKDLKWACDFKATLSDKETTTLSSTGNYLTPGEILRLNGRSWENFENDSAALADVHYLVERNKKDHFWDDEAHPPEVDSVRPEYSRFWYIKALGKTHSYMQEQKKEFSARTAMKNINQLKEGMQFLEGTGFEEDGEVNIESVKHAKMIEKCDALK